MHFGDTHSQIVALEETHEFVSKDKFGDFEVLSRSNDRKKG